MVAPRIRSLLGAIRGKTPAKARRVRIFRYVRNTEPRRCPAGMPQMAYKLDGSCVRLFLKLPKEGDFNQRLRLSAGAAISPPGPPMPGALCLSYFHGGGTAAALPMCSVVTIA